MKASSVFRSLSQRYKDVYGSYDDTTHTMTLFIAITEPLYWRQFREKADRVRQRAVMRKSTVLDVWTIDPSAPKLKDRPTFAIVWHKDLARFLPAVNVATVNREDFMYAQAQAISGAAEANLIKERSGNMPTKQDLPGIRIIIPGAEPGTDLDPGIADMLARINGPSGAEKAGPTSQKRDLSFPNKTNMQAPSPGSYSKRINTAGFRY